MPGTIPVGKRPPSGAAVTLLDALETLETDGLEAEETAETDGLEAEETAEIDGFEALTTLVLDTWLVMVDVVKKVEVLVVPDTPCTLR